MAIKLNAYIHFKDNAKEAMEFYHSILGGDFTKSTFGEFQMSQEPSEANKIMHSEINGGADMTLMGSDTPQGMEFKPGNTITLSLSGDDAELLTSYFEKLSAGGKVDQPLTPSPWGDTFGMLTDKFGIEWMVNINSNSSSNKQ